MRKAKTPLSASGYVAIGVVNPGAALRVNPLYQGAGYLLRILRNKLLRNA